MNFSTWRAIATATLCLGAIVAGGSKTPSCVPVAPVEPVCAQATDCDGLPHADCTGGWSCAEGACVWACGGGGCADDGMCKQGSTWNPETCTCVATNPCAYVKIKCPIGQGPTPKDGQCVCAPKGCYSDQDCDAGTHCNAPEACLPPPGCDKGEACPAVCYGVCLVNEAPKVQCGGPDPAFPTFSKACGADGDCAFGKHQINCCGTQIAVGLAKSDLDAFQQAEAICEPQYPQCGCATFPTKAEDGGSEIDGEIQVGCLAGACMTFVN